MREELGAEVEQVELLGVLENIFRYEGRQGHEVVFVYDAVFRDRSLYERGELQGLELDTGFTARWRSVAELARDGIRLVPEGLAELLMKQGRGGG